MNRKIKIAFIASALTGSFLMAFLLISDYMKGPELELHSVTVELGEEVKAWSFVSYCSEPEASIRYVEMPDFSVPGGQEVSIEAIDVNGKKTIKRALLRISIIKGNLKLEASSEEIQLNQILVQGIDEADVSFRYKPIKLNHIGVNEITLVYQDVEYKRDFMVFDSIAPEVLLKEEISCYQYHEFDARSAVDTLTDATEVLASVKGILDTKTIGEYPVTLVFTELTKVLMNKKSLKK